MKVTKPIPDTGSFKFLNLEISYEIAPPGGYLYKSFQISSYRLFYANIKIYNIKVKAVDEKGNYMPNKRAVVKTKYGSLNVVFYDLVKMGPSMQSDVTRVDLIIGNEIDEYLLRFLMSISADGRGKLDYLCARYSQTKRFYLTLNNDKHISNVCSCKESALYYLFSPLNGPEPDHKEIIICEKFSKEEVILLKEWQKKIPVKDRFSICRGEDFIKLSFPSWWWKQKSDLAYYRLGWALLACRLANKRENFDCINSAGILVPSGTLGAAFDAFKDGKFSIKKVPNPTTLPSAWSGSCNWRRFFSTAESILGWEQI